MNYKLITIVSFIAIATGLMLHRVRSGIASESSESAKGYAESIVFHSSKNIGSSSGASDIDTAITESDRSQLNTLLSIFKTKNDNDPRLDTDLKVLSAGARRLLREQYDSLSLEKRNERGTIVFLLGRNISEESDIAFFARVLREEQCLSMGSCKEDQRSVDHSAEGETGMEVSLAYPQLMALKALERILALGEKHPLYRKALEETRAAAKSPVDKVSELARELDSRYAH